MNNVIYIDGRWYPKAKAKVSVYDHGLLYGDGVFEGIRAYNGRVFRLDGHLNRLARSAKMISLKLPTSLSHMEKIIYEGLRKNKLKDSYIRLLVTRGPGDLGLDPRACPKASLIVIVDRLALFPRECYENGLKAIVAKTRRNFSQALDPTIKSMNYLNNILAKIEAVRKGVPEALMLNKDGYICECTGDNVFYVKGNLIVTPPVAAGVLEGVTRNVVNEIISKKTSYKLKEKLFGPGDLFRADEVFFTGTAAEIIPVTRIDGRKIGKGKPGPITLDLISKFKDRITIETR